MNRILLIVLSTLWLNPFFAQNLTNSNAKSNPNRDEAVGLYALWYQNTAIPELYLNQPYVIGGQMVYQWRDLESKKGKCDFSKMAQELDGLLKANDKKAHISIQNGSENLYLHMVEVTR